MFGRNSVAPASSLHASKQSGGEFDVILKGKPDLPKGDSVVPASGNKKAKSRTFLDADGQPLRVTFSHHRVMQHTLVFERPIVLEGGVRINLGLCNLYGYPACAGADGDEELREALLHSIMLELAMTEAYFWQSFDSAGACPFHCLCISNSPASLKLVLDLFRENPVYTITPHHPASQFAGEHALHIIAVNGREKELCAAIRIAQAGLDKEQLLELCTAQPRGDFFNGVPMRFYGGTLPCYLAAYGLKRAFAELVNHPVVAQIYSMVNKEFACKISGFLPIHAAVANGQPEMYDFLCGRQVGSFRHEALYRKRRGRSKSEMRASECNVGSYMDLSKHAACDELEEMMSRDRSRGGARSGSSGLEVAVTKPPYLGADADSPPGGASPSAGVNAGGVSQGSLEAMNACCRGAGFAARFLRLREEAQNSDSGSEDEEPPKLMLPRGASTLETSKLLSTANGQLGDLSDLSPLQLAAKLGDARMCEHILNERLVLVWKWGPLTALKLCCEEIDSGGSSGNDVMEIVARLDAHANTQALLLDTFMQGFVHELFVEKWNRYAGYLHWFLRVMDVIYLLLLVVQGFALKINPMASQVRLSCASLTLAVFLSTFEVWLMILWWKNETSSNSLASKLTALFRWGTSFMVHRRLICYSLSSIACVVYIAKRSDGADGVDPYGNGDAFLWLLFGISTYAQGRALIGSMFISPMFPQLGVHSITIARMFENDVRVFVTFLMLFTINSYSAMFIAFPRAGSTDIVNATILDPIAPFDTWHEGLDAMINMAITGVRFAVHYDLDLLDHFNAMEMCAFIFFHFAQIMFAIFSMILLLRLLMAMMTNTFQGVKKAAELEWRLLIARNVLRLELMVPAHYKKVGTPGLDGKHYIQIMRVDDTLDGRLHVPLMLAKQKYYKQSA